MKRLTASCRKAIRRSIVGSLFGTVVASGVASASLVAIPAAPGGEAHLWNILNAATGSTFFTSSNMTAAGVQLPDKVFELCPDETQITVTVLAQQAGHAAQHSLYYYQPVTSTPLGTDLNGSTFTIGTTAIMGPHSPNMIGQTSTPFAPAGPFGLLLDDLYYATNGAVGGFFRVDGRGYYPSQEEFDPAGGDIHFAVFADRDAQGNVVPCSLLIAVEDLHGGGDGDHNDIVFRMQGVSAIPEPSTAFGLVGLVAGGFLLNCRRPRSRR